MGLIQLTTAMTDAERIAVLNSDLQFLKQQASGSAGLIAYFAQSSPPDGWLAADGSTVSRTTYADLFDAIGTTYGVGDGSTTFVLPDVRGLFFRAADNGRGIDINRVIGSEQDDLVGTHSHPTKWKKCNDEAAGYGLPQVAGFRNRVAVTSTEDTGENTGNYPDGEDIFETRPKNIALLACIKY